MALKIGYAGDRELSVKVLSYIKCQGIIPQLLLISDSPNCSHNNELKKLCNELNTIIIKSSELRENVYSILELNLDYLICVHFPFIIPEELLMGVNIGVINLHPAFLPYNRGWNTPTWAIIDNTPFGATLHFMDSKLDTGDIIAQEKIEIFPDDTADSLYKRTLELELELFKSAWPMIMAGNPIRIRQDHNQATSHKKGDIKSIQKLELSEQNKIEDTLNLLRGLTTNNLHEAAYFERDGQRYYVQIKIFKEPQT